MNMTMTDTHVNEYWFKSGEVKTASYRQSVSPPPVGSCGRPSLFISTSECWIVQSGFHCSDRRENDKRWSICVLYHYCIPGISWFPRDRHKPVPCLGITASLSGKRATVCTHLKCRWLINSTAGHCGPWSLSKRQTKDYRTWMKPR